MNKGADREILGAALYMPSGGGEQTKKKDRTQVLKLDKSAGHTPAVSEHGHRFKSPNLRQDVG